MPLSACDLSDGGGALRCPIDDTGVSNTRDDDDDDDDDNDDSLMRGDSSDDGNGDGGGGLESGGTDAG